MLPGCQALLWPWESAATKHRKIFAVVGAPILVCGGPGSKHKSAKEVILKREVDCEGKKIPRDFFGRSGEGL